MINAIQFALNGLTGANRKAEAAAQDIAVNGGDADLAADAVTLAIARTESKANAKVIETANEMSDDLLHIFDERV
jgi:hypothetical protein